MLLLQPLSGSASYALEPARGIEPSVAVTATEAIVVAGTRTQRRLSESPVATEVITRAQLAQSGARTAADVLETRAGVQIARTFRGAAVRLQGLDPKHVLVLVDGERLSGKLDGAVDLARLAVADIDSIEIVRGAASALYGSDAIGGVIAIATRKARGVSGGEFRISGGSFGAASSAANADASGQVTLQRQSWGVRLSGTYQRQADFDLDPSDAQTSGSALESWASTVRGDGEGPAASKWHARIEYGRRNQNGIDSAATGAVYDRRNATESVLAHLGLDWPAGPDTLLQLSSGSSWTRDQFALDQRGSAALDQYADSTEQVSALHGMWSYKGLANHKTMLGADGQLEQMESPRLAAGRGNLVRAALFAQDEWAFAKVPTTVAVAGLRFDSDSRFGTQFSPKVGLRLDPRGDLVVRASYGRGYRAPQFKEQLLRFENPSAGYVVQGNPNLVPERSHGLNAGAEWQLTPRLGCSAEGYLTDVEQLITIGTSKSADSLAPTAYIYQNIGRARTWGAEGRLHWAAPGGVRVALGYTWSRAMDVALQRELEGRSRHRVAGEVSYRHRLSGIALSGTAAWVGSRPYRPLSGATVAAAYLQVDARASHEITERWQWFVEGHNLANAGDAEWLTIPPRRFDAGVQVRF